MGALDDSFKQYPHQKPEEEVSAFDDIIAGLRRVPAIGVGFLGDAASLLRIGADEVAQNLPALLPGGGGFPSTANVSPQEVAQRQPLTPEQIQTPIGSDAIMGGLESLGIPQSEPETGFGRAAEFTGLGFGAGATRGAMNLAKDKALSSLVKPVVSETAIGAGAGGGVEAGSAAFGEGALPVIGGAVTGGLGAAGGLAGTTRLGRLGGRALGPLVNKRNIRIGDRDFDAGLVNITSDLLASSVKNVDETLESLVGAERQAVLPQTVPELLDSTTLAGLQKSVTKTGEGRSPLEAAEASQRQIDLDQKRIDDVGRRMSPDGDPRVFIAAVGERKSEVLGAIEKDINRLESRVKGALGEVAETGSTAERSVVAKNTIENNLKTARKKENRAWTIVKPHAKQTFAPTAGIKQSLVSLRGEEARNISPTRKVPDRIQDKIRNLPNEQSVFELQALRSDLLDEAALARVEGQFDRARKLNNLQSKLLDDIIAADTTGALRRATRESSVLNETYNEGTIGRILGLTRKGDEAVAPTSTLGFVTSGTDDVATKLDDFLKATGPEGVQQVEGFLRNRFQQVAVDEITGEVDLNAARRFLVDNRTALETMRPVRQEFEEAISKAIKDDSTISRRNKTLKGVNERGQAAKLLGAEDPVVAMRDLFNSKAFKKFPDRELGKLYNSARSIEEKRGLTRLVMDEISGRSLKESNTGRMVLDPLKLADGINRSGMRRYLEPGQKQRMNAIVSELKKFNRLSKEAPKSPLVFENESQLTDILAAVVGARLGGAFGGKTAGGTIQSAGRGSRLTRKLVASLDQSQVVSLLEEAIFDPDVFRTLLTRSTATNDIVQFRKLRGFMLNMNAPVEAEQ